MAGSRARQNGTTGMPSLTGKETGADRREASLDSAKLGGDAIGRALQAHFRNLASEPIPDRFLDLLASLENKEKN